MRMMTMMMMRTTMMMTMMTAMMMIRSATAMMIAILPQVKATLPFGVLSGSSARIWWISSLSSYDMKSDEGSN